MRVAERLQQAVMAASGAPCEVSIGERGVADSVVLTPETTAGRGAVNAFDWSDAAQAAWELDQQPERKNLLASASQAIADNDAFLALASPTNAQVLAQVRKLTQHDTAEIKRLIQLD
jgi:hypothetical protein